MSFVARRVSLNLFRVSQFRACSSKPNPSEPPKKTQKQYDEEILQSISEISANSAGKTDEEIRQAIGERIRVIRRERVTAYDSKSRSKHSIDPKIRDRFFDVRDRSLSDEK
eukprot:TRINITY_DN2068_c0_g1_i1.p1 TRINITY_DN2068_c0_g1~~TRINITY_DN2068_c0_g1_i1.p1  ORF type:complete len:129 (+),score=31.01 TRINITY_DN2068_c0_g1_i1:56-388(+)